VVAINVKTIIRCDQLLGPAVFVDPYDLHILPIR